MEKIIIFGTKNQTKRDRFQKILEPLKLKVISLNDLAIKIDIKESGNTPEENAVKKVKEYYSLSHIPTFSIDYGLYIDKFPKSKQPGLFVRRIYGDDRESTDEKMLDYYISELKKIGGESKGSWVCAVALAGRPNIVFHKSFTERTLFVTKKSPVLTPGEPLNSIQIHPITKRYKSEMSAEEKAKSQDKIDKGIFRFIRQNLKYI